MKTKIMLINPPTIGNEYIGSDNYFPLGLLYLTTVVKNNDMDVVIVDINNYYYQYQLSRYPDVNETMLHEYIENHLYKQIEQYMPDIIGVGAIFSGAFRGLRIIADRIKNMFPNMPIVIGGISATMFAREILRKYSYIDYVVIGEGEATFLELVNCITNKKSSLDSINGIAFRHNGDIKLNPKTEFMNNLDALPFADYSILNVEEYKMDTPDWYSPKEFIRDLLDGGNLDEVRDLATALHRIISHETLLRNDEITLSICRDWVSLSKRILKTFQEIALNELNYKGKPLKYSQLLRSFKRRKKEKILTTTNF